MEVKSVTESYFSLYNDTLISMGKVNVAVFVSGSGSNFENIVEYFKDSDIVNVALMVSSRSDCLAMERAKRLGIPAAVVGKAELSRREIVEPILVKYGIRMIVLAALSYDNNTLSCYINQI